MEGKSACVLGISNERALPSKNARMKIISRVTWPVALLMASVSPQDAYLHQVTALDTLGIDRPETQCKF